MARKVGAFDQEDEARCMHDDERRNGELEMPGHDARASQSRDRARLTAAQA
jgi:hypothetical protein